MVSTVSACCRPVWDTNVLVALWASPGGDSLSDFPCCDDLGSLEDSGQVFCRMALCRVLSDVSRMKRRGRGSAGGRPQRRSAFSSRPVRARAVDTTHREGGGPPPTWPSWSVRLVLGNGSLISPSVLFPEEGSHCSRVVHSWGVGSQARLLEDRSLQKRVRILQLWRL